MAGVLLSTQRSSVSSVILVHFHDVHEQHVLKKSLRKYHLNGEEKRQEVLKEIQLISANTDA